MEIAWDWWTLKGLWGCNQKENALFFTLHYVSVVLFHDKRSEKAEFFTFILCYILFHFAISQTKLLMFFVSSVKYHSELRFVFHCERWIRWVDPFTVRPCFKFLDWFHRRIKFMSNQSFILTFITWYYTRNFSSIQSKYSYHSCSYTFNYNLMLSFKPKKKICRWITTWLSSPTTK